MLNKVENIVAKGEIAHHEQFHLWWQCFQKSSAASASNASAGGKGLTISKRKYKKLKMIYKTKAAECECFLLFPLCFWSRTTADKLRCVSIEL